MAYVSPIWLEGQRRRWQRHDWQRFVKPELMQRKNYTERLVEQRRHREEVFVTAEHNALSKSLLSLRCQLVEVKFQLALRRLRLKALHPSNFQPRVPKGNPDGGQWTAVQGDDDVGAGGTSDEGIEDSSTASSANSDGETPGIGHNGGPPLEDPPAIPPKKPSAEREKNNFLKTAARWLATAARLGRAVNPFVVAYEAMSWLDTDRPMIESYQDEAKTLPELQQAVSKTSARGYNDHHIVEQGPARKAGDSEEMIEGPDNKVRIPTLKHWEITGWYQRPNPRFKDPETGEVLSPRKYLEGKDWEERRRVGLEALIEFGVLKK